MKTRPRARRDTMRRPIPKVSLSVRQLHSFRCLADGLCAVSDSAVVKPRRLGISSLLGQDVGVSRDAKNPGVLVFRARSRRRFTSSVPNSPSADVIKVKRCLARLLGASKVRALRSDKICSVVGKGLSHDETCRGTRDTMQPILRTGPAVRITVSLRESNMGTSARLMARIGKGPATGVVCFGKLDEAQAGNSVTCLCGPCVRSGLTFSLRVRVTSRRCCPKFTERVCLGTCHCGLRLLPGSLLVRTKTRAGAIRRVGGTVRMLRQALGQMIARWVIIKRLRSSPIEEELARHVDRGRIRGRVIG